MQQMQALAQLLTIFVPQAFSSDKYLTGEEGIYDEWKLTKISGRSLMSLIYFRHRGAEDGVNFYKEFTDHFIRGSHSIDGTGLKMIESISIGLTGGGGSRKIVKKPGWAGRNITKRDWAQTAERDNAQVVE